MLSESFLKFSEIGELDSSQVLKRSGGGRFKGLFRKKQNYKTCETGRREEVNQVCREAAINRLIKVNDALVERKRFNDPPFDFMMFKKNDMRVQDDLLRQANSINQKLFSRKRTLQRKGDIRSTIFKGNETNIAGYSSETLNESKTVGYIPMTFPLFGSREGDRVEDTDGCFATEKTECRTEFDFNLNNRHGNTLRPINPYDTHNQINNAFTTYQEYETQSFDEDESRTFNYF